MRKPFSHHHKFPWEHFVDEENKVVYVYIPSGWPTTLALPIAISKFFPDYKGEICTKNFLVSLQENQK